MTRGFIEPVNRKSARAKFYSAEVEELLAQQGGKCAICG